MNLNNYKEAICSSELVKRTGKVVQFFGLIVESMGPDAFLGELCEIHSPTASNPILAEVVGLKNGCVLLMPYGDLRGISLGSEVAATGRSVDVSVGDSLLGRVIDSFGKPLDEGPEINVENRYPLYSDPINPLQREKISDCLETGVRSIDSLLTVGKGQRIGIFAGSGVGKSTLLGMIARNMKADVNVIALIGERGREVKDFIEESLGEEGLAKSVVIAATADQPALVRTHAAFVASAIAEYFRDQGKHVVLTMDSVTRFATAQREIGLAIGEPPTSRGYTPSVFTVMPRLLERGGRIKGGGSITAFYTVLVDGDDMNDPIADNVRSILDGHIVLSRDLANSGHFPAVDILQSVSRLMPDLASDKELKSANDTVAYINTYDKAKDMVELGAYRSGTNPELDAAIGLMPEIETFLKQDRFEKSNRDEGMFKLNKILSAANSNLTQAKPQGQMQAKTGAVNKMMQDLNMGK